MTGSRILALIPARGGSRGVPRKNIRPVAGRPLIAYTIDVALTLRRHFCRILLSTEDAEIAAVGRRCGLEVPYMRPIELAGDRVPSLPVVRHAVDWVERQDAVRLDWICLLQPTTPLRAPADVERALALAGRGGCDSVISVVEAVSDHPIRMKRIEGHRLLPYCIDEPEGTRRQDLRPAAYRRNGAIFLSRRDVVMESRSLWGEHIRPLVMPAERSVDVDDELDLKLVDLLIRERGKTR